MIPDYAVYIAIPFASCRQDELRTAAESLELDAARVLGVDLFYRADTDVLLLLVRLDSRGASHAAIERLREAAERADAAVLEPARLDPEDRKSFFQDYLPRYPFHLTGFPTVTEALRAFGRDLGLKQDAPDTGIPPLAVRFRRGDDWQHGRVKSVSREGLHVVTGALPRVGDIVDLSLTQTTERLGLRGEVVYVTRDASVADVGGSGFSARFLLRTGDERQTLDRWLRAEGVSKIRGAPSRCEARYPVKWPLTVRLGEVAVHTAALDVSSHGMFVGGNHIPGRQVDLLFHIDDEKGPLHAGAKVVRRVEPQDAATRGIPAGVGVMLTQIDDPDALRFHSFVDRVARRAHRAVVVATEPARAQVLSAHLQAAGYIAYAVSEPQELIRLATQSPPDMVLCSSVIRRDRAVRQALASKRVLSHALEHDASAVVVRGLVDAVLLA